MDNKGMEKGEFILLGVFAVFVGAFMLDISRLPIEGKLLSYILAPFILIALIICLRSAWADARKSAKGGTKTERGDEETHREGVTEHGITSARRFWLTLGAGFFLFGSIYLVGFYWGCALMLFFWFIAVRKLDRNSIAIVVCTPLLLYGAFELFLDMGLPQGELFAWLGF